MKDSFIFYRSYYEALINFDSEIQSEILKMMCEYILNGNEITATNPISNSFFKLIKPQLEASDKRYQTSIENGKKGGRPKKEKPNENLKKPNENLKVILNGNLKKPNENLNYNYNYNYNDNYNVNYNDNFNNNNIYALSEQSSSSDTEKANDIIALKDKEFQTQKHKYGEYKHVLLKDTEFQILQNEYSNADELIKYLDEYIEMKGYKAKSHYLAIKKWVVDAVKREKGKEKTNNDGWEYLNDEFDKIH